MGVGTCAHAQGKEEMKGCLDMYVKFYFNFSPDGLYIQQQVVYAGHSSFNTVWGCVSYMHITSQNGLVGGERWFLLIIYDNE